MKHQEFGLVLMMKGRKRWIPIDDGALFKV